MSTLNVSMGDKQRRSSKKLLILLYTIIPFLAFFSYIYLTTTLSPKGVLGIFVEIESKPKYETFKVSFDSDIPSNIRDMITESVDDIQLGDIKRFEFVDEGKYVIKKSSTIENTIYFKEYIPVGHIYWVKDIVNMESVEKVYVNEKDIDIVRSLFPDIQPISTQDLESKLKESEEYIGLVTVEDMTPALKILSNEGKYILDSGEGSYIFGYTLEGNEDTDFVSHILKKNLEIKYGESMSLDTQNIVKINMSGVVAITRGLALKMDSLNDFAYPAQSIGTFLADADLTHVSNEVSFIEGCTSYSGMRFCSKPQYLETLKASGVDIVELTGNHNNDFGASNNTKSIEMIKDLGWDYFGGGLDTQDASKILYKEIKGSKIAFVGYNYYDTMQRTSAIASDSHAGANSYSVEKLTSDIAKANENADITIVTFQFQECYSYPPSDVVYPICYKPLTSPDQKAVFRKAIDLGADIVVGTQAHQPQTFEVYNGGLIYYGLGNLYFDQYRWIGTRQGLILSIYIQNGKLLQSKLTPILMERDLIPRIAKEADSNLLLNLLKSARNF